MGLAERKLELMQEAMALNSIDKVEEAIEKLQNIRMKGMPKPPCSCSWEENERIIIERINKFDEVEGIPAEEADREIKELMDAWDKEEE